MNDAIQLLARALITTVFIIFGYQQFTNIAGYTANPNIVKFSGMIGGILAPVVIAYLVAATLTLAGLAAILFRRREAPARARLGLLRPRLLSRAPAVPS